MKILIVDTYYEQFLRQFEVDYPELRRLGYEQQWSVLMAQRFAESDSYSHYLRELGHEATEIIANAGVLQRRWAKEHGVRSLSLPGILIEQVKRERPDVLYMQNADWLSDDELESLRPYARLIVGQIGSALPRGRSFSGYDLIISCLPQFVRFFRNSGLPSELLPLGFDPRVLSTQQVVETRGTIPLSFVGGISRSHRERVAFLETVAQNLPLSIWGYGKSDLPGDSILRGLHKGPAWALEMYRAIASSRISLNSHVDIAGPYAANLRLYEATGVGSCLVTEARDNLPELFTPDTEVVSYRSAAECIEKCQHLLEHEEQRRSIAQAGQRRTLSQHTYEHRMRELEVILSRHLHQPRRLAPASLSLPSQKTSRITRQLVRIARQLPGQHYLRKVYHLLPEKTLNDNTLSWGQRLLHPTEVTESLTQRWQASAALFKQQQLADLHLLEMYQGTPNAVFRAAAEAVRVTDAREGRLVEVGCASGYNYEALSHLLKHELDYIGLDHSTALVEMARRLYPEVPFVVGDATQLPLPDRCCDILFSGVVPLHVPDYTRAVAESARVTRRWCIFHQTPVHRGIQAVQFEKLAYGIRVPELLFGEAHLLSTFESAGLVVETIIPIESYEQRGVGKASTITYVCRKQ